MSAVVTPESAGETVVREIEGVGTVVYENFGVGEWLTKKGEPAKKARRRYLLNDVEVDSVSSIVGTLDKPALQYWIEDQATRGAVQAERLGELDGVHEDDYMARVQSLGLGASAARDEGANRGTVIHSALHLLTEGKVPNPADYPDLARPWVQGAMRAWLALNPESIASEQIVAHPLLEYAGRPDLVAMVDGKRTLIDWKSGRGRVFDSSHYQVRLYEMALRHCGLGVERVKIVGIADNGSFEVVDCEVTEADACALIVVFRARKRANAGMAAQRKIAKAAAA